MAILVAMKFKLPNGVEFEGDAQEFAAFTSFLADLPTALQSEGLSEEPEGSGGDDGGSTGGDPGGDTGGDGPRGGLAPGYVAERLSMVGASSDIERVTVIAQLAVEAGMAGADYQLTERLYTDLGLRKPARFTKAVANAKAKKYITTVGQGTWKPTYLGENYARGLGRATREPAHRRAAAQRPQLSLHAGGDDDA
jgi:hypothetical protein